MPNRRYQRGYDFERRCLKALEAAGWVAWRSPGSKGPADLIALKAGQMPRIYQAKSDGRIPDDELQAIWERAQRAGAIPGFVYKAKERGPLEWREVYRVWEGEWEVDFPLNP